MFRRATAPASALALVAVALVALAPALRADHPALGPVEPSAGEQYAAWVLNRARHDPAAYGSQIGVDLSGVAPQPPLAVNTSLTGSSRFHAREMLDHGYFGHTSVVTGIGPNQMAVDAGYDVFGLGLGTDRGTANNIESIAKGVNSVRTFPEALELLIVDRGVPSLGHRRHLLAMETYWQDHREIGCGRAASGGTFLYAIHTAWQAATDLFLTGVVYFDADGDAGYDEGEGLPGVTVDAGGGRTATSMGAGGWSILVPPGTYDVTASGGAFQGVATASVTVTAANREIDFRSGAPRGVVDFGAASGPTVTIVSSATVGAAPLQVDFTATSSGAGTAFEWDFGALGTDQGVAVSRTFGAGLHTVVLRGTDDAGAGADIEVIAADGPAGAGAGTTPPASRGVVTKKLKAKVVRTSAGQDTVSFTGRVELPAGLAPGPIAFAVDVGGVLAAFDLDAKGRGASALGTALLKYRRLKTGAPTVAGQFATVKVSLRGDFAAVLGAMGMRDATETRTVTDVPVAVLLGELGYRATLAASVKSRAGLRSTAVPAP